jgi:hypothetical protein
VKLLLFHFSVDTEVPTIQRNLLLPSSGQKRADNGKWYLVKEEDLGWGFE